MTSCWLRAVTDGLSSTARKQWYCFEEPEAHVELWWHPPLSHCFVTHVFSAGGNLEHTCARFLFIGTHWDWQAMSLDMNTYLLVGSCFLIQGIVGEADENGEEHYLWTYKKLEIGFNGNRIVDVNLTSEGKVRLMPNTRIPMSYSVSVFFVKGPFVAKV